MENRNPFNYSVDFQKQILQFVVSSVSDYEGSQYLSLIHPDIFDLSEMQVVCNLVQEYFKKYTVVPKNATNLLEFLTAEGRKVSFSDDVRRIVETQVRAIFDPLKADTPILKEAIIAFARYKMATNALTTYAPKIKDGVESIERLENELRKARTLDAAQIEGNKNHGKFLIADYSGRENFTPTYGHPTFLNALNRLTAARGFHSPQLIIILGGPKSFKTGTLLNFAKGFVLDGLKVYYADGENGTVAITNRMKQCFLGATFEELAEGTYQGDLDTMIPKMGIRGGDFICDHYPAYTCTIKDVELRLTQLKEERQWVPDVIFWDSLDHFNPSDSSIKEHRHKSRAVYFDAINLNTKLGCFALTPAQVNRAAVEKKVITMQDFAEDFSKAMNAHACFALCRTPDDIADGFARLVVVMQREGQPYQEGKEILLAVNAERQQLYAPDYATEAKIKSRWLGDEIKETLFDND